MSLQKIYIISLFCMVSMITKGQPMAANYVNNRSPLLPNPYIELPLGTIKARGWLLEMLKRQRSGISANLDELYPEVLGPRNGWLGGDGDQWERGPYWIDGLLPLAYILNDDQLKRKVQPWIEWTLQSQRKDGFFGPSKDYEQEKGLQRTQSEDWWPRIVVLKFLKQYYMATGDQRVIHFMSKYFQYQLKTLPKKPLGHWTTWAVYRACDNLEMVYWLYNRTGEKSLLDLAKLIHHQSYDYIDMFLNRDDLQRLNSIHGVNLAQGIKGPVIYYQQNPEDKYIKAVKKAFADIRRFNGQPNGMYGADESLHGNNPTQGSELCSAAEMMFSLEEIAQITGDVQFMDHLERIAFNALPTQISDDFKERQYFQQANQVMITKCLHNFDINHGNTDLVYGLLTGYPCCTCNLHQAWPKFTQNLWYATNDNGLAALVYSPSEVTAKVSNGVTVHMKEETLYPMDSTVRFVCSLQDANKSSVKFPFHLRIPEWCDSARVNINGKFYHVYSGNNIAVIERLWKDGDTVELQMPMHIRTQRWYENSVSIERGPLVYGLKIEEHWVQHSFKDSGSIYGKTYSEVYPMSKWNYGLIDTDFKNVEKSFQVIIDKNKQKSNFPWNLKNAPIEIKVRAKEIPSWKLYNQMAGPLPYSGMIYGPDTKSVPADTITLIPYGCTTLRISEFPIINTKY